MGRKKKKTTMDKLIMGAIVGAAVGSVIGSAVAPDKGEKTRKKLKNKAGEVSENIKNRKINSEIEEMTTTHRKQKSLLKRIFGRKSDKKLKSVPVEENERKEI